MIVTSARTVVLSLVSNTPQLAFGGNPYRIWLSIVPDDTIAILGAGQRPGGISGMDFACFGTSWLYFKYGDLGDYLRGEWWVVTNTLGPVPVTVSEVFLTP